MSLDEQDYAEKRDFIRMFINAPVDFALTGTDDWYQGMGKDLSGGGISFISEHSLSEGDKLDIKLHPITEVTPPLEAVGVVTRAVLDSDGKTIISTKIEKILG